MSGVAVIRYLLATNAPLIAVVPAARIMGGSLPIKTVRPAISVFQISSVPRITVSMGETKRHHLDRVQVSVLGAAQQALASGQAGPQGTAYPGLRAILALVFAACPHTRGVVNGINVDSILPDIEGPDLSDDVIDLNEASRDFLVRWNSG